MDEINLISTSDRSWVEGIWKKNKGIFMPFEMVWKRYWEAYPSNERWVGVNGLAFAHYRKKKNKEKTLYEIAVKEKRSGLGSKLIDYIGYPMLLSTDLNNVESNNFYIKKGFILIARKQSRNGKKTLNCYKRF